MAKRTRTPNLYPEMLQYIKSNPDATKQDVVDEFISRYPSKAETTLAQYYHKGRNELGLPPNGKPGRKKTDTSTRVRTIVKEMLDENPRTSVSEMKQAVVNDPHIQLSLESAQTYVYTARKQLLTN